ncbi:MAG: VWA domain-containing protein [Deltaproteobacteria bacterium]|nr:VWA domain-containing protein [Deltaproteobacteria bacterium]
MEFARPIAFALLIVVAALLAIMVWAAKRKRAGQAAFASRGLWATIQPTLAPRRDRLRIAFVVSAAALLVMGIAGPRYGTVYEEVRRRGVDLVVALDVSKSMLAEDFAPNRLEKAKHQLESLLDRLQGDRIAIVPFAGEAHLLCPLTLDYSAAKLYLSILDSAAIPTPGTNIAAAITESIAAFEDVDRKHKVMLLLTDGESLQGDALEAARKAAEEGIAIHTIGIGSPDGVPIPITNSAGETEYKKDAAGNVILSKLDEETLESISRITGGTYYRSSYGEMELDWLIDELASMEKRDLKSQVMFRKKERFWPFAVAAFVLLTLEALLPDRPLRKSRKKNVAPESSVADAQKPEVDEQTTRREAS